MFDDAPLYSHYSKLKIKESEQNHAKEQLKMLTERVLGRSNPVHQSAAGGPSTSATSTVTATAPGGGGTDGLFSSRIAKSFRRILREETEGDIIYQTDSQDPDLANRRARGGGSGGGGRGRAIVPGEDDEMIEEEEEEEEEEDEGEGEEEVRGGSIYEK